MLAHGRVRPQSRHERTINLAVRRHMPLLPDRLGEARSVSKAGKYRATGFSRAGRAGSLPAGHAGIVRIGDATDHADGGSAIGNGRGGGSTCHASVASLGAVGVPGCTGKKGVGLAVCGDRTESSSPDGPCETSPVRIGDMQGSLKSVYTKRRAAGVCEHHRADRARGTLRRNRAA